MDQDWHIWPGVIEPESSYIGRAEAKRFPYPCINHSVMISEKVCLLLHADVCYCSRVSDPDPYPDPYWIRIQSDHWIRIRIRNLNTDPDPDPGGQK